MKDIMACAGAICRRLHLHLHLYLYFYLYFYLHLYLHQTRRDEMTRGRASLRWSGCKDGCTLDGRRET